MAEKALAMCRGILHCYLAFELDESDPHVMPGAIFTCESVEVPVPVYPLEEVPGAVTRRWVAVFPHARGAEQQLAVIDRCTKSQLRTYQFSYAEMKWQSRLAYRTRKSLTARMRDIEQTYWGTGVVVELINVFPASNEDDIMRIRIVFPCAEDNTVVDVERLLVRGSCKQFVVMEDGQGDDGKRHVTLSMRVAHEDAQTFILSQDSCDPACQPGLIVIDAPMHKDFCERDYTRMMNAGGDPAYPRWLAQHRVQAYELSAQREKSRGWSVSILIVVDKFNAEALSQSLAALGAQSAPIRGIFFAGTGAKRAKAHMRAIPEGCDTVEIVRNLDEVRDALKTEYVLVMDEHDILEPNAIYEFVRYLHDDETAQLVYPDDDRVDKALTSYCEPRLKQNLDIDALYASNYVGSCVLLRTRALDALATLSAETAEQLVYGASLALGVQEGAVAHVPRVLCHRRDQKRASQVLTSDPQVLADHLHAQNVSAHITREGACNRVVYDVADPEKLVSIVIPTKDHASMLEACVDSIFDKAGYGAFEIVLVENNSTEAETFAFYEDVTKRDERVRVVTYEGDFNFSKIVNYGVSQSKGELVLVLNNDTEAITDGFLRIMAGYLERSDVGVVGPLLRYPDGLVQNAGIALMASGCLGFMNQNCAPEVEQGYLGSLAHPREYSAVLGACFMVRREDFDAVGGLTEELAVTYNDVDFCWKLRKRGLACVFTPYAELYHLEFASRGRDRVNAERAIQTELEAGIMRQRWPRYFACGDPAFNPACNQADPYFKLGR